MEALAGRLFARHREGYLAVVERSVAAGLFLVVFVPAMGAAIAILGMARDDARTLLTLVVPLYAVLSLLALRSARRGLAPLAAWLRGEPSDPLVVWEVARRAPNRYLTRLMLGMFAPLLLIVLPQLRSMGVDAGSMAGMAVGSVPAAACAWVGFVVFAEALLRPVMSEVGALLPAQRIEPRRAGLSTRLAAVVLATAFPTGVAGAAAAAHTTTTAGRVGWAMAGSLAMAAYLGFVFTTIVIRPVLQPIRDLTAGTARVRAGDLTHRIPVTTSDELGGLASSFNAMQRGLAEREALHAAFGTYVDPGLAERVLAQGDSTFSGEQVEVTVFFVDVRGFTTYSEGVEPAEAFALLNRLFDVVVPVVRQHAGHPNRYLGDGLLAVFGAPEALPDHADRAVAAAREIQRRVTAEFDGAIRIGIGISTGPVIAGTIGGGGKLEYTVIGDAVNVAARVEQLTKDTGDPILLTDATRSALSVPDGLRDRGAHELRGKAEPVRVWSA